MKAYSLDLRERVIAFVEGGGTRVDAARLFNVSESSVYRYLEADKHDRLAPKTSWGHWRKLDPQQLTDYVAQHKDATLAQLQKVFGVSHNAIWIRLGQLGITLKKTHQISRTQRSATVAVSTRTTKTGQRASILSGRMRRRPPTVP